MSDGLIPIPILITMSGWGLIITLVVFSLVCWRMYKLLISQTKAILKLKSSIQALEVDIEILEASGKDTQSSFNRLTNAIMKEPNSEPKNTGTMDVAIPNSTSNQLDI